MERKETVRVSTWVTTWATAYKNGKGLFKQPLGNRLWKWYVTAYHIYHPYHLFNILSSILLSIVFKQ